MLHNNNNVMVVGDDAQSIYAFRGAHHKNILQFPSQFENSKMVVLDENYRSTQPILSLANHILKDMKDKFDKNLFTQKISANKPNLLEFVDERAEASYVVSHIEEILAQGKSPSDVAVLVRGGKHSFMIEGDLLSKKIPFKKFGGLKLTEMAHIKDIICLFRAKFN